MTMRWMNKGRNFITSALMLAVSTEKAGVVGPAVKSGVGSGRLETGGAYTGAVEALYTVEIDSTAGGSEVGQAAFRWKDGGDTWQATGIVTASVPINLNNGVTVKCIGGSGADFVLGDAWTFNAVKHFGRARLLDLDRNTAWRSAGLSSPDYIRADLGQPRTVTAFIIGDHNFTEAAEIRLQADDEDSWTSPAFDLALTWSEGPIALFLDQTYRYWRLAVTDTCNSDGFVRVGEFYLGEFLEPSSAVVPDNFQQSLMLSDFSSQVRRAFSFDLLVTDPDQAAELAGFLTSLREVEAGRNEPFFFCRDASAAAAWTGLVRLAADPVLVNTSRDYQRFELSLIEEPKSHV